MAAGADGPESPAGRPGMSAALSVQWPTFQDVSGAAAPVMLPGAFG